MRGTAIQSDDCRIAMGVALRGLNLGFDRFALCSRLQRVGVHAQQSEECLAAAIGQENAKGKSSKYGTGKT
jgi:hypothetical protein